MASINQPLQLQNADIAVCFGPAALFPGLVWPRFTTPPERLSRGNSSWTFWVLTHMLRLSRPPRVGYFPHQQLSSCADVRALSPVTLTLLTICFSLSAPGWVRVWEWSLQDPSPCTPQSFCDSSRMCEPDDEEWWGKKQNKTKKLISFDSPHLQFKSLCPDLNFSHPKSSIAEFLIF